MSRTQKNVTQVKTAPSTKTTPVIWKDRLLPEEYDSLKNTFDLFDEDQSGLIDPQEINKIMEELGDSRKGAFTYSLIESLKSKGKPINFDQFLDLVCPKVGNVKTKEGLRTIFNHIDKESDEVLDFEQLKILARMSGDGTNDDEILEMLHTIYVNQGTESNERLTFDEFYGVVSKFYKK